MTALSCQCLLPSEVAEIAASAVPTLSRKKLKQRKKQMEETQQQPGMVAATYNHPTPRDAGIGHREKIHPAGDQMDPLIAWYSLVAKPIPRKLWASMPKAQEAVDAEWKKLRECDGGRGTWDESTATNYWEAQRQAKEKLARTGVRTHFGALFDI